MSKLSRRKFIKISSACAAFLAGLPKIATAEILKNSPKLASGGKDFSPYTKKERKCIPSACWQCVSRDAINCFVENDRLVKIEGNHRSIRNRGKICSKGQAGINQLYDPDRILHPLKRTGKRGEGKWKRISWDEALKLLVNGGDIAGHKVKGLKTLRDEGHPEQFMFHYGRLKGSDSKIVKDFLKSYGTKTIGNHTSICEGGKWTAQELIWGKHYDVNDTQHTNMILNFGCNFFETHTSHIQFAQRAIDAIVNRGVKLYTFDIRLSNTAAKSTEWIPINPGTDLAVALAMCNVIMQNNLYNRAFIEKWTTTSVNQLKTHLKQYTPEWAEKLSSVPAAKIEKLAIEFAKAKPGTCVSYRGAVATYNGVEAERAFKTLDAICGYIDIKGGTCHGIGAKWKYPKTKTNVKAHKLKIIDGFPGDIAFPTHHASHQVLKVIKDGKYGRPHIYMIHAYQPVYVNGECQENIDILKDEKIIPFFVAASPFYGESESLADLIIPDVTYLERRSWDDMVSYEHIPEFYLRQQVVKPIGESRQFQDVVINLAKRLAIPLAYKSSEDFIKKSCELTKLDYENLKKNGVYHDPSAKPKYSAYTKVLKPSEYTGNTIIFDRKTGVYWDWKKSKAKTKAEALNKGYTKTKKAYKGYKGQRIGSKVYAGFKPDKLNKSGKFEIYSELLKIKGFNPLPSWFPVPAFEKMKADEFKLSSFKISVQTHSRTQNCKWLTEIYYENPALINPVDAKRLGIEDGMKIKVTSKIDTIITKAKLSEGIIPGVIGISNHCGHWQYGRYASGKKAPLGRAADKDLKRKWWSGGGANPKEWGGNGVHPNWLVPLVPDPISGQWCMNNGVVKVSKA